MLLILYTRATYTLYHVIQLHPFTHECKIIILQIMVLLSVYTIFIKLWNPLFFIHRPTSTTKCRKFIPVQTVHINIFVWNTCNLSFHYWCTSRNIEYGVQNSLFTGDQSIWYTCIKKVYCKMQENSTKWTEINLLLL